MLGYGLLFDVTAFFLIIIWLVGLWQSVQHTFPDIPEETSVHFKLSRRFLSLIGNLIAFMGTFHAFWRGFNVASFLIWLAGSGIVYGLFFYWYLGSYTRSDLLIEKRWWGFSAEREEGFPRHVVFPHWIFHNKALFSIGFANLVTGPILVIAYWDPMFLIFAAYGSFYLTWLYFFNWLDVIKVWDDRVVFKNGCFSNIQTAMPLDEIESVEIIHTFLHSRFGLSAIQIKGTKQRHLRFTIKDADKFKAEILKAE